MQHVPINRLVDDPRKSPFRLWSAETGVFVVVWLALLAAGRDRMIRDPGTFWHTVVGRQILETHRVVRHDPFGFRHAGDAWLSHQWLGEVVMALIDRAAGLDGLLLASITLLAATYAWAARRLLVRGVAWPMAAIMVALAIAASSYHFLPRPHLIGIPLLGLLLATLSDYEAGRTGWRRLLWLPLIFLVWANTHGTALGGLATFWIAIFGWIVLATPLGRMLGMRTPPAILPAVGVAIASTLICLVNPFGVELPRVWIGLLAAPSLPRLIVEHAPLSLRSADGWSVVGFGVIYLVILWRCRKARPGVTSLVPLIWLALSIQRIRHGPLFAMTALVALANLLPLLIKRDSAAPLAARPPWYMAACLPALFVALVAACQISGLRVPLIGAGWVRLDPTYWPVNALPALQQRMADGPAAQRVLNEMLFGGFLIYHVPEARIFIDDRCELYRGREIPEYVEAGATNPSQIDRWSRTYDARTALVFAGLPFDKHLQQAPGWQCLYRDVCCALYARTP